MSPLLTAFRDWLVDYYVVAGLLMFVAAIGMLLVRQPARRLAIASATVAALFALAVLCAMPAWPRFTVSIPRLVPLERAVPAESFAEQERFESEAEVLAPTTPAHRDSDRDQQVVRDSVRPVEIGSLAAFAFLSVMLGIGMWLVIGAVLTSRLRRLSRRAPEPIQTELTRLCGRPLPAAEVLLSEQVNQALAIGIFEPRIILPERFLGEESCEAVEAALAHELAHVRNGDLRMLACLRLLLLLLFAHPLFWWLRSRIRIDQELLADAAAGERSDVAEYAEILLDWFRTNAPNRARVITATLGLWEGPHLLKRRISMLLNEQFRIESRSPAAWRVTSWLLLTSAALLLSAVTLREGSTAIGDDTVTIQQPSESKTGDRDDATAQTDDQTKKNPKRPNDTKYETVDDAWRAGAALYNASKFAQSRKPFEAALKLAPDDKYRIKVYEVLRPAYRQLSNPKKMIEACDFIIRNSDSAPKRSITRRDLLSFVHQRGKVDKLIDRYEVALKKDAKDRTSLYVLSEVYNRLKRDPKRAAELTERLLALNSKDKPVDVQTSAKLATQLIRQKKYKEGAELFEKIAPLDEGLAAWHWKEAATAWIKLKENDKALAAARKSAASSPENRSQLLEYFWYRHLGEVFLATEEPKVAIVHLQKAIDNTMIEGYINDCRKLIEQAKAKAGGTD
jgi:beta-lactamase regulating signal transducer with metallopeptidase domain